MTHGPVALTEHSITPWRSERTAEAQPTSTSINEELTWTSQCIFFVEWEIHVQVTPLDRPLPPGEGWGEGLPATSVKFNFFTPSEGEFLMRWG